MTSRDTKLTKAGYHVHASLQSTVMVFKSPSCLKSNDRDKRRAGLSPRLICYSGEGSQAQLWPLTGQVPCETIFLWEATGGEGSGLTWASCISWPSAHAGSDERGARWKANNNRTRKAVSVPRTANPILCL